MLKLIQRIFTVLGSDYRLHHYPKDILSAKDAIQLPLQTFKQWTVELPWTGWMPGKGPEFEAWKIPLATHTAEGSSIDFTTEFDHYEDTFALHRFGWMLHWLSLRPSEKQLRIAERIILKWIQDVPPDPKSPAWETYSVSERVANWLIYFCATTPEDSIPDDTLETINISLNTHLEYIINHLEYHWAACNNHIINNARALYIGGHLLNHPEVVDFSKLLLRKHISELIDPSGILLEGSTHYQLLVTRSIREICWFAHKIGDTDLPEALTNVLPYMNSCINDLGGDNSGDAFRHFPKVGDLSPDYPIEWFLRRSAEETEHKTAWSGLWDSEALSMHDIPAESCCGNGNGQKMWRWVTKDNSPFKIFIHTNRSGRTYPPCHGHMDYGSFMLYARNSPILADRGRYRYGHDPEGQWGVSAEFHNTSTINGLPVLPSSRGIFAGYNFLHNEKGLFEEREGPPKTLVWKTHAVKRIHKSFEWQRCIRWLPEGIDCSEILVNPEHCFVHMESFLHLSRFCRIKEREINPPDIRCLHIRTDTANYILSIGEDAQLEIFRGEGPGFDFWEYGKKQAATTLRLSNGLAGDIRFKWSIRTG